MTLILVVFFVTRANIKVESHSSVPIQQLYDKQNNEIIEKETIEKIDKNNNNKNNDNNQDWSMNVCEDVKLHYNSTMIKMFMQQRAEFFLKLTDKMNETYLTQKIGPQYPNWKPAWLFYDLLGPVANICPWELDVFDQRNLKAVCGIPKNDENCIIISLGSANDFFFEEDIFKRTKCKVKTFDCTVNIKVPKDLRSRVEGFRICMGPKDEVLNQEVYQGINNPVPGSGFTFYSWPTLLAHVNLSQSPEIVKMDIEAMEFSVIRSIFSSLKLFPSMFVMELHFGEMSTVQEALLFVNYLHTAGYVLMARTDNKLCSSCTEVLYKRIFC